MNSVPIVKTSDIDEGQDWDPEINWLEDAKYHFTSAEYIYSNASLFSFSAHTPVSIDVSHLKEKFKSESFTVNNKTMGGDPKPGKSKFLRVTFKRGDPKLDF